MTTQSNATTAKGSMRKRWKKSAQTPKRRAERGAVAVLLALALLASCAPMSAQVRDLDRAGRSDEAATAGLRWLAGSEATADPTEVAEVKLAVAKALFAAAARVDRHEDWRKARERMPLADATVELVEKETAALEYPLGTAVAVRVKWSCPGGPSVALPVRSRVSGTSSLLLKTVALESPEMIFVEMVCVECWRVVVRLP